MRHQPGPPESADDVRAHPRRCAANVGRRVVAFALVRLPGMGPGTGNRIAFGRRLLVVEQPAQQLVDVLLRCRGTSEFVSRNQVFQRQTVVPLRPPLPGALVWAQRRRPPTLDLVVDHMPYGGVVEAGSVTGQGHQQQVGGPVAGLGIAGVDAVAIRTATAVWPAAAPPPATNGRPPGTD